MHAPATCPPAGTLSYTALPCRVHHHTACCRRPHAILVESPCLCLSYYAFLPLGAHCHLPATAAAHRLLLRPCMHLTRTSKHQACLPLSARKVASHFTSYNTSTLTPNHRYYPRNTSRFDGGRTSETAILPVSLTSNWLQYSYLCVSESISNVARLLPAIAARTPSGTLWLRGSLHLNSHHHPPAPLVALLSTRLLR